MRYGCNSPGSSTVRDAVLETTGTRAGAWSNARVATANPAILRMLIISTFRIHRIQRHRPNSGAALQNGVDPGEHTEGRDGREQQAADDRATQRGGLGSALARADGHREHAADH